MSVKSLEEEAIFKVARKIPCSEVRDEYLEQVCGDDPVLRERIRTLLVVHDNEPSFLALWREGPIYRTWLRFWLSMAHARLGNEEEAKKFLDEAVEATRGYSAYWPAQAPIEFELMRREAASLLQPGSDNNQVQPERDMTTTSSNAEGVTFHSRGSTRSGVPWDTGRHARRYPEGQRCEAFFRPEGTALAKPRAEARRAVRALP